MAANMLRKFGFKKHEPRESEARLKLQKELFSYNTCVEYGFPQKPTALAYDPKLKLVAIGTKSGAIRVFGKPGVEFSGRHQGDDIEVRKLFFLPDQARLISLCSDNSLHLWEINEGEGGSVLEQIRSFSMEASKLKTISTCCLTSNAENLLMGTEGGNIHILDVNAFKLTDQIIYQDVVIQNVPDDFKVNPGAVEAIEQHPSEPTKFLIGYDRGLIVLWDNKDAVAEQTYNASQQLESISWHQNGTEFMSAHADGSHITWSSSDSTKSKGVVTPYGPYHCKPINKLVWKTAKADPFLIFSGGLTRGSFGDRHGVTVMQGDQHVIFDFTSKVVDFVVLCTAQELEDIEKMQYDDPHSLIVLLEEELVAIDLQSDGWPVYKQPYMASIHSCAVTYAQYSSNVPETLWNKIKDAGENQMSSYSTRDWPVTGGQNLQVTGSSRDFLITGHEDGSVRFWDASNVSLNMMYKLDTAPMFGLETGGEHHKEEDEGWPPFKKVGTFDPFSDDPRLAVHKIVLCSLSETLVLSGTAGQVVVFQFEREERTQEVKPTMVNVVSDRDNFVWKGHDALPVKEGEVKYAAGFQPTAVMQLSPPAACTALALHAEWNLIAAGTAHGFAAFDYLQKKDIATKCTLNPDDLTGTADSAMSRRKSFKKSLRESFRRLRNRRSQRANERRQKNTEDKAKKDADKKKKDEEKKKEEEEKKEEGEKKEEAGTSEEAAKAEEGAAAAAAETPAAEESKPEEKKEEETKTEEKKEEETKKEEEITPAPAAEAEPAASKSEPESKPVERQIESRALTDEMTSMVKSLYFANTFLVNSQNHTPTLWAGTAGGTIFAYQITVPEGEKRDSDSVVCQLAKEIQLKHRAPVVGMCILDKQSHPLPGPLEVTHERAKAPDMSGGHSIVIISEEQFKVFTLPNLKAHHKYKLTAHEGSRVRRVAIVNFRSKSDERYNENDLALITNQGDVQVFTMPQFRRQLKAECVRKENVTGIISTVFTETGEGMYMVSPSEFVRFSLSARFITKPSCGVELKEGMRPPPPEPEVAEVTVEEGAGGETQATPAAEGEQKAEGEEKPTEENDANQSTVTVEGANDSIATGDITVDSIRDHLSSTKIEDNARELITDGRELLTEGRDLLTEGSSIVKTTVIKTRVISETINGETTTSETKTVTSSTEVDGEKRETTTTESNITQAAILGSNLDDDTKLTKQSTDSTETEPLEELHISEDEEKSMPSIAVTSPFGTTNKLLSSVQEQVETVVDNQASVVEEKADTFQQKAETQRSSFQQKAATTFDDVKETAQDNVETVTENVSDTFQQKSENVSNKGFGFFGSLAGKADDFVADTVDKVEEKIDNVEANVSDKVDETAGSVSETVSEVKENVLESAVGFGQKAESAVDVVDNKVEIVHDKVGSEVEVRDSGAGGFVGVIKEKVVVKIDEVSDKVVEKLPEPVQATVDSKVDDVKQYVSDKIDDVAGGLGDKIGGIAGGMGGLGGIAGGLGGLAGFGKGVSDDVKTETNETTALVENVAANVDNKSADVVQDIDKIEALLETQVVEEVKTDLSPEIDEDDISMNTRELAEEISKELSESMDTTGFVIKSASVDEPQEPVQPEVDESDNLMSEVKKGAEGLAHTIVEEAKSLAASAMKTDGDVEVVGGVENDACQSARTTTETVVASDGETIVTKTTTVVTETIEGEADLVNIEQSGPPDRAPPPPPTEEEFIEGDSLPAPPNEDESTEGISPPPPTPNASTASFVEVVNGDDNASPPTETPEDTTAPQPAQCQAVYSEMEMPSETNAVNHVSDAGPEQSEESRVPAPNAEACYAEYREHNHQQTTESNTTGVASENTSVDSSRVTSADTST